MRKHVDIKLLAKFQNDRIDRSPLNKNMHINWLGQALTHFCKLHALQLGEFLLR